jgi:hypothetical protein
MNDEIFNLNLYNYNKYDIDESTNNFTADCLDMNLESLVFYNDYKIKWNYIKTLSKYCLIFC